MKSNELWSSPLYEVKELLKRDKIEYDAMILQRRRLSTNKSLNKTRFKWNLAQDINFDFTSMTKASCQNETSTKTLKSRSNSSSTESSSSKVSHFTLLGTIKNVNDIDLTLDDDDDDAGGKDQFKENTIKRKFEKNW
jgi:hypothetical protein